MIVSAVKAGQSLMESQTEQLEGLASEMDDLPTNEAWTWKEYVVPAFGFLIIALSTAVIYLLIKTNKLAAMILVSRTHASEPPLVYTTSTTTEAAIPPSTEIVIRFTPFEITVVVILLTIATVYGISKLWARIRNGTEKDENFLALEIKDHKRHERLYWMGLTEFLSGTYTILAESSIENIRVEKRKLSTCLKFDWRIFIGNGGHSRLLPNQINLSWKQARSVTRLVRRGHVYQVHVGSCVQQTWAYITPVETTSIGIEAGRSTTTTSVLQMNPNSAGLNAEPGDIDANQRSTTMNNNPYAPPSAPDDGLYPRRELNTLKQQIRTDGAATQSYVGQANLSYIPE